MANMRLLLLCSAMQAQALESAVKRFSKLEDAAHEAQLATDIHAVRHHVNC